MEVIERVHTFNFDALTSRHDKAINALLDDGWELKFPPVVVGENIIVVVTKAKVIRKTWE